MYQVWFTSDTHFAHSSLIDHTHRPFKTVEEMDETLIENWNSKIQPNDTVWHLGDVIFRSSSPFDHAKYLDRLNGRKHLVKGNHDTLTLKHCANKFCSIHDLTKVKIDHRKMILCHYPLRSWEGSNNGSWHLHGHCHTPKNPSNRIASHVLSMDVGVDGHEFMPWSFDQIREYFEWRESLHPRDLMGGLFEDLYDHHEGYADALK